MEWKTKNGLRIGFFPALRVLAPELCVFVTSRLKGESIGAFESLNLGERVGDDPRTVQKNRLKVLSALGISPGQLVRSRQSHGTRIAIVNRGAKLKGFDGFATTRPRVAAVVSTADCYPVVLYSPPERALVSLHVGRMGAREGIIENAVRLMKNRFSVDIRSSIAVIGPGICRHCYSVPSEEAMKFPDYARELVRDSWHLDLKAFIIHSLILQGFDRDRIVDSRMCTSCNPELFYSHRRDKGRTGRHWTIALADDPWAMNKRLLD